MRSKFKDEHPFEKRKAEAERIRQKYADRIPVSTEPLQDLIRDRMHGPDTGLSCALGKLVPTAQLEAKVTASPLEDLC